MTNACVEPPQYSSFGVREQTQELASWVLGESSPVRSAPLNPYHDSSTSDSDFEARPSALSVFGDSEQGDARTSFDSSRHDLTEEAIEEVSESVSVSSESGVENTATPNQRSGLIALMRDNPGPKRADENVAARPGAGFGEEDGRNSKSISSEDVETGEVTEASPLLPRERLSGMAYGSHYKDSGYSKKSHLQFKTQWERLRHEFGGMIRTASHPRDWDVRQMGHDGLGACAAVFLGLLLNILDALSYGRSTNYHIWN